MRISDWSSDVCSSDLGRLAANRRLMAGLRDAAARGAALYGECGGFMLLGAGLTDAEGRPHAMAGLPSVATCFHEPRRHLGYRRITAPADLPSGPAGDRTSVVVGKSGTVRVDLGGSPNLKNKTDNTNNQTH